tara:strand:+ start:200 stop:490 length:291 start_codon:yes stop_codon:yes gene_type:complete
MVIEFTARHFHAPDNIWVYAESEVERLNKFNDRITNCQIILERSHNDYMVEINVSIPGNKFNAKAATDNMTKSIDLAVDKTANQLKKHMEIIQSHH